MRRSIQSLANDQPQNSGGSGIVDKDQNGPSNHQAFSTNQPRNSECSDNVVNADRVACSSPNSLQGNHPKRIGANLLTNFELHR